MPWRNRAACVELCRCNLPAYGYLSDASGVDSTDRHIDSTEWFEAGSTAVQRQQRQQRRQRRNKESFGSAVAPTYDPPCNRERQLLCVSAYMSRTMMGWLSSRQRTTGQGCNTGRLKARDK
jgi:hypothetical protein